MCGSKIAEKAFQSPVLPPELLDMIFSALAQTIPSSDLTEKAQDSGKAYLTACALVCHAWREVAQPYLFKHFKCTMRVDLPCVDTYHAGNRKLDTLAAFLQSSPKIRESIRSLQLDMSTIAQVKPSFEQHFSHRDPHSCPVRLMKVLQLLPRLEIVNFAGVSPNLLIPMTGFAKLGEALPALPKLDTLRIDFDCRPNNAVSIYKVNTLLAFFGEVRHLEIQHAEIIEERDYYPELFNLKYEELCAYRSYAKIPSYCKYESISLHDVRSASALLLNFAESPSIVALKSLRLGCMFAGGSCGLTGLMRAVSENLEHLEFRAECTPSVDALNLSCCKALTSLEVVFPMHTSSGRLAEAKVPYMVLNNLPRFLLSAPLSLRSVSFRLRNAEGWVSQFMADFAVTVRGIEDALVYLVDHKGLRTVTIDTSQGPKVTADSRKQVLSLVKRIHERRALRIVETPSNTSV